MTSRMKLYVKGGCPWCVAAKQYLDQCGFQYEEVDVRRDSEAFAEMIRISGQNYAPTLTVAGKILADFGTDELQQFLKTESILPSQCA